MASGKMTSEERLEYLRNLCRQRRGESFISRWVSYPEHLTVTIPRTHLVRDVDGAFKFLGFTQEEAKDFS